MTVKLLSRKILIFMIIFISLVLISFKVFESAFQEFEDTVGDSSVTKTQDDYYKFKSLRSERVNVRVGPSLDHNLSLIHI